MTVQLPPDLMKLVEAQLASGRFSSTEEVLHAALLQLGQDDPDLDRVDEERLREAIAEGEASGEPVAVDFEKLRARLKAGLSWRN